MKPFARMVCLFTIVPLLLGGVGVTRADDPLQLDIQIADIIPPTTCSPNGWTINYERSTAIDPYTPDDVTRYVVQYLNDDLNLVHYWGSGYSAYVQDYWVEAGTKGDRSVGNYIIPYWTDTYQAVSSEYILHHEQIVWETRAELECDGGKVAAYRLTSEAAQGKRTSLPKPGKNLILALEDIPRYRQPFTQTGYLGTISACQTFYVSGIYQPRASLSVWGRDSLTGQPLLLNGNPPPPIVDVPEDYGQTKLQLCSEK
jgi:hypothetical protein